MSNKKPPRDQRRSFRCTVADGHQPCLLKVGSQVLSATLQDESAGGFSVLVDRPPGLKRNETAELQTSTGRFEVKVIHMVEIFPPKGLPPAELAKCGPWFRLGLRRLSETSLPRPPRVSLFAHGLHVQRSQWCPASGALLVLGLLLALTIASAPLVLLGMNWRASRDGSGYVLKLPFSNTPLNLHLGSWAAGGNSSVNKQNAGAAQLQQAISSALGRMPDVALFAEPHAVRQLQLNAAQQDQLRQLIDATSQAVRDLDAQLQGGKRPDISNLRTQVTDEAYRTALNLLTDQQRAQWEKMTAKP